MRYRKRDRDLRDLLATLLAGEKWTQKRETNELARWMEEIEDLLADQLASNWMGSGLCNGYRREAMERRWWIWRSVSGMGLP